MLADPQLKELNVLALYCTEKLYPATSGKYLILSRDKTRLNVN